MRTHPRRCTCGHQQASHDDNGDRRDRHRGVCTALVVEQEPHRPGPVGREVLEGEDQDLFECACPRFTRRHRDAIPELLP